MKVVFWLLACVGLICLMITNLMLSMAVVTNLGFTDDIGLTPLAIVSGLLWLVHFFLFPTFLAWKFGKTKFMSKRSKRPLVFMMLLFANLPIIPLLYALHPRPVLLSLDTAKLSDAFLGEGSRISSMTNWLFAHDVQSSRIYLGKDAQVRSQSLFESRTGNFGPQGRALFEYDDLLGYLQRDGSVLVEPTYSEGYPFSNDRAFVKKQDEELFGLIDDSGKVIVAPTYKSAQNFEEGVAYVVDSSDKAGFIDLQGAWVLELLEAPLMAPSVSGGLIRVPAADGTEYFDLQGRKSLAYPGLSGDFFGGITWAQDKDSGLFGFVDSQLNWRVKPTFSAARNFADGLAAVKSGSSEKWDFVNSSGEIVLKDLILNDDDPEFHQGRCAVEVGGYWGFIDKSGTQVIEPVYTRAAGFSEGLAQVYTGGTYGFIDLDGKVVIEPKLAGAWRSTYLWSNFQQVLCSAPVLQSRLGLLLGNPGGSDLPAEQLVWSEGQSVGLNSQDLPPLKGEPGIAERSSVAESPAPDEHPVVAEQPVPEVAVTPEPLASPGVVIEDEPTPAQEPTSETEFPAEGINISFDADQDGEHQDTDLRVDEGKIFAYLDLSSEHSGKLKIRWLAQSPENDFQQIERAATKGGKTESFFANPPTGGWLPGSYEIQIYLNDDPLGRKTFQVLAPKETDS